MTKPQAVTIYAQSLGGIVLLSLAAALQSTPLAVMGAALVLAAELRLLIHALLELAEKLEK